jgi:hypothetical protein
VNGHDSWDDGPEARAWRRKQGIRFLVIVGTLLVLWGFVLVWARFAP